MSRMPVASSKIYAKAVGYFRILFDDSGTAMEFEYLWDYYYQLMSFLFIGNTKEIWHIYIHINKLHIPSLY
jgi:hypothetical protein